MIKYLIPLIMLINTTCLALSGSLKTKEVEYFKYYKSLKGKFQENTVFEVRKRTGFYHFTGYRTVRKTVIERFEIKKETYLTPCKAIHKFCIQCAGNQKQVRHCETNNCPLFAYRFGKNPRRKGIGNIGNIRNPQKTTRRKEIELKGDKKIKIIIEEIPE